MNEPVDPLGHASRPFELEPFRALRYNAEVISDLGSVTCPPYDVISAHGIETFQAASPHNIVRLILPEGADKYAHAAAELASWIDAEVLVRDDVPALYVYELTDGDAVTVGLVGAVSVSDSDDPRVLPHENVFGAAVADRAALMLATGAHLEPILLTYDGGGIASDVVDDALRTPPSLAVTTADGARHRLWRISDPATLRAVAADLEDRQALIADGHHRYAAYRAVRDHPEAPAGASHGLAMLVDAQRHPLRLGAIHRSVSDLDWDAAAAAVRAGFATVDGQDRPGGLVLTDGERSVVLSDPDRDLVASSMPSNTSEEWRSLPASLLCEFVLPTLLGVPDTDPRVAYHHDRDDALRRACDAGGVALLVPPAELADVVALAARGERMPRKSTSFGPKPRTGLLMRQLP